MANSTGPTPAAAIAGNLEPIDWYAYNRTGVTLTVGAFVQFDQAGASAQTETERTTGGIFGNVITPATANIGTASAHPGYVSGVVIDLGPAAGVDNSLIKVRVFGAVQAQITAAENIAFGDRLGGVNAVYTLSETAATGLRVYALADEEIASAVAGTLYWVQFNGLTGWGMELS